MNRCRNYKDNKLNSTQRKLDVVKRCILAWSAGLCKASFIRRDTSRMFITLTHKHFISNTRYRGLFVVSDMRWAVNVRFVDIVGILTITVKPSFLSRTIYTWFQLILFCHLSGAKTNMLSFSHCQLSARYTMKTIFEIVYDLH